MSRIDEIKERAGKTALSGQEWMDNYRGDVQYLLSRLEIAEMALLSIAFLTVTPNEKETALEALEQIRE